MVWEGGDGETLAGALVELWDQLTAAYPSQGWQNSPDTGTIGDASHRAEGSASDHNPWLNNTVRAMDIANEDPHGPDCEALFEMFNRLYGQRDPRIFPDGYVIYRGRITDPNNPGGYWAQQGDPHNNHLHVSVSRNPSGYNSRVPWPIGSAPVVSPSGSSGSVLVEDDDMAVVYRDAEKTALPVLVSGSTKVVLRSGKSAANAAKSGAQVIDLANVDYLNVRQGAA